MLIACMIDKTKISRLRIFGIAFTISFVNLKHRNRYRTCFIHICFCLPALNPEKIKVKNLKLSIFVLIVFGI